MARAVLGRPNVVYSAREGDKFNADTTLVVETCPTCHIVFAIPESLRDSAKRYPGDHQNGWSLCCPLGHSWHYKTRSFDQQLQDAKDTAARANAAKEQAEASARAQRGVATRARNERDRVRRRAAAGVCPCCNRTFQQLARHMKSQHPGFDHAAD